ncbi:MAG: hypothetical protein ACREIT_06385, partial [Tepidisphaeraceae bacterium]
VRPLDATIGLDAFISEELNRPFDAPGTGADGVFPFRPFVLDDPAGDSHFVGVVYQHWIADSVSIRLLLREWFVNRYDPRQARLRPVNLPRGGYWRFFGPHKAGWRLGEGFLSSVRWSSRFKRVRRIERQDAFSDFRVKFSLHAVPDGWIDRLHAATRGAGTPRNNGISPRPTLNDLFLAAIAEACHRHVPVMLTPKRQDLALGTIVDLRPHGPDDLSDTFGMFLGFTSVVCRPRDLEGDWPRLVRTIATQSALHKQTGVPQASPVRMLAGLVAGRLLERDGTVTFYRKRVPLAGGISNVNLNRTWAADYHPDPLIDYMRVSPTGPMMPLVFTTTTLGKRFHFGLTRRASIINDDAANAIASSFIERLTGLIG